MLNFKVNITLDMYRKNRYCCYCHWSRTWSMSSGLREDKYKTLYDSMVNTAVSNSNINTSMTRALLTNSEFQSKNSNTRRDIHGSNFPN